MDVTHCDACGTSREMTNNTMANDSLSSSLPSKIDPNYGDSSNSTDEAVVVVPAQGAAAAAAAAGVLKKEKALKQPLNIEIAVENKAEEENMRRKQQRLQRVCDGTDVMNAALLNS